jgi:uridine kinase
MLAVMAAPLIGIGGGTGAGKSSLARRLVAHLGDAVLLALDAYYHDRSGVSESARSLLNFDDPRAIDIERVLVDLDRLAAGDPIDRPIYSFVSHTRVATERVAPASVILVDGLWSLWWPELRARFTLKVYVDAPGDVRLARRLRRDVAERGRDFDSVIAQYFQTVRPMHDRYVEPTRIFADLVLSHPGTLEDGVAAIMQMLTPAAAPLLPATGHADGKAIAMGLRAEPDADGPPSR